MTPDQIETAVELLYRHLHYMDGEARSIEQIMRELCRQRAWGNHASSPVSREIVARIDLLIAFLKATKDVYEKEPS